MSATWVFATGGAYPNLPYTEISDKAVEFGLLQYPAPTAFVSPDAPLPAGTYSLNNESIDMQWSDTGLYTFLIHVEDASAVPEPASLSLLAGGMVLLTRRRR